VLFEAREFWTGVRSKHQRNSGQSNQQHDREPFGLHCAPAPFGFMRF
jgi:hypothetical protein